MCVDHKCVCVCVLLCSGGGGGGGWKSSRTAVEAELFTWRGAAADAPLITLPVTALDFLICLIRDCFGGKPYGRAVFDDGSPSDLCFERRQPGVPKVYAHLYVDKLEEAMQKFTKQAEHQADGLRLAGFNDFATIATEDLMAFGMSEDGMEKSIDSWCEFLRSIGINPDRQIIWKVLQGDHQPTVESGACGGGHYACTPAAHPEKPHLDSIYNVDEVYEFLQKLGNQTYLSFFRHHMMNKELVDEDT